MSACHLCGASLTGAPVVCEVARYDEPQVSVACARCGLVQATEIPSEDELAAYYSGPYRERYKRRPVAGHEWGSPEAEALMDEGAARYAERILAWTGPVSAIEIGAGDGRLGLALRKAGVRLEAFEPDESIAPVDGMTLTRWPWTRVISDTQAVIAAHVLEHLRDPLDALLKMRRALRGGEGRVWLEVPNVERPYGAPESDRVHIDRCGLGWFFQRPHLWNFSPHTMALLLARAGFDGIEIEVSGLVIYARAVSSGSAPRSYEEAVALVGEPQPGAEVAEQLAAWERAHRRGVQLQRFVDGDAFDTLGADAIDVVRAELRLAVDAASLGIESLSALHDSMDGAVTELDAGDWEGDDWARGFAAGRAYGLQRAQVATGLAASQLTSKAGAQ